MAQTNIPLAELVEALPPNAQEAVRDFVEHLLARYENLGDPRYDESAELPRFPVDPQRPAMLREIEAYHDLHPQLLANYKGQYVAIYKGELVDRDSDSEALTRRILAHYPDQVVLQRKVEKTPEVILHFRSPRFLPVL